MVAPLAEITGSFTGAFYLGTSSSTSDVPARFHCALAGRGYMLDIESGEYQHRSIALLKGQLSTDQDETGESSINPEGAWRRATDSWHLGAGQTHRDDIDSISQQYRSSKGIDPWTRGQLSLLHDTTQAHADVSTTTMPLASTDAYVYWVSDAQQIGRTDLTTNTACTGEPAANVTSLASDGKRIFAAFGASGVYRTNADNGTVFASFEASAATLVAYVKGRVLSASGSTLRDISTGTAVALTPPFITSSFVWSAIAEGVSHVYAAGNSGDKGLIWRLGIKSDGTGLDVPIVAGRLPDGETVHGLYGYLGRLFIGTSRGVRVAAQGSSGDLTIGPLIDIGTTVYAFVGRGQFVWFAWSNYDATSTGTGRLDVQHETEPLVPAYASDLMVTGQGTVDGLAYLGSNLAIGLAGTGIYKPSTDLVASGTLESGTINYGIVEDKLFVGGLLGATGDGTAVLSIAVEGGDFTTLESSGETERGTYAELRITLTRATAATGPTVESQTLFAYPAVTRTELIVVPLLLHSSTIDLSGGTVDMNVSEALDDIRQLVLGGQITTYQERDRQWTVRVEDYVWLPHHQDDDPAQWQGTCVARLKAVTT
jgi:hypothetical protein